MATSSIGSRKKNLGAKYPDLKEALEKWERNRAPRQPLSVVQNAISSIETCQNSATQRPITPNEATPQVPTVLIHTGNSRHITTPSKANTQSVRVDGNSPSIPAKSPATKAFSGSLGPAQALTFSSPPFSPGALSQSALQDCHYELGDYEDGDCEEDD